LTGTLIFDHSEQRCGGSRMLYLLKAVSFVLELPGVLVLLIVLFLIIFWKRMTRAGRIFLTLLCVSLYAISAGALARLLVYPLEGSPAGSTQEVAWVPLQEGRIVVLGGGAVYGIPDPFDPDRNGEIGQLSLKRVYKAYRLYRSRAYTIFASGGTVLGGRGAITESELMARALEEWGVPSDSISVENRSRNTYENARYILEQLPQEVTTIYLVTSAIHMKRARLAFRRTLARLERSVEIVPMPTDYTLHRGPLAWHDFAPTRGGITASMTAVHEYLGLLFYVIFY
jgi:uncharacterized SAM-binding protein YcdF (DUF218 family)